MKIEVDVYDAIGDLGQSEKREMYEYLKYLVGAEDEDGPCLSGGKTVMDSDMQDVLVELWNKRNLLTMAQRELLTSIANGSSLA
jgi:hypothetical protein